MPTASATQSTANSPIVSSTSLARPEASLRTNEMDAKTEVNAPSRQGMAPAYDTFHEFSQLPTELKVKTLRERLLISSTITELTHGSHSSRVLLGLIRANKELQALAFEIYYGENTFQIGHRKRTTSGWTVADEPLRLRYPHPTVGSWIRTLELRLPVSHVQKFVLENWVHSNYQILMITPNTDGRRARWQQWFPNLTHLHIALIFENRDSVQPCLGEALLPLVRDPEATRIEIKTTELVVEVSGLYCSEVEGCSGSCAETIAQTIRGLVEIRDLPHDAR
jgi:hypothetical protein